MVLQHLNQQFGWVTSSGLICVADTPVRQSDLSWTHDLSRHRSSYPSRNPSLIYVDGYPSTNRSALSSMDILCAYMGKLQKGSCTPRSSLAPLSGSCLPVDL